MIRCSADARLGKESMVNHCCRSKPFPARVVRLKELERRKTRASLITRVIVSVRGSGGHWRWHKRIGPSVNRSIETHWHGACDGSIVPADALVQSNCCATNAFATLKLSP